MRRFAAHRPAAGSEASGSPWAIRARRRCRESVELADPQWRHGALAPGGPGELRPSEGAFRVGVDELLEGGLVDEHGGYGPLASSGVVGAQGVVELDAGRSDRPAGAGAAEQSPDGLRVRTVGVGVGVETNGGEVVGRGVLVGEGVGRGESGLRGGSVSPALGLCLAPGPACPARLRCCWGRRFSGGSGVAGTDVFSARCSRLPPVVSSTGAGGWVASASRARGRRRSVDGRLTVPATIGSIIRSYEQSWQVGSRVARGQRALAVDRVPPRPRMSIRR